MTRAATAGSVVNVFLAILIGSFSLALLAPEMQAVTHARGAAAKLYETIDRVPAIDSASAAGLKPASVEGLIRLENVSFTYPSRPGVPIVKDLSIAFPAGKTAALVGASGSGKSTIVALVERFYDPLAGRVTLDGHDIRELNLKWLRTQIGLVSQEPTLFGTTIRANVAHGLIGTPHEFASADEQFKLIKEACVKANADGFIGNMPLGYDTLVGERGFLMSGGQKQRIAIARAIVGDPRVLLLDEATSALDTQSEGIVQDALDKAAAGRTTITIAHRLSTIKDAGCIYVMGEGVVLEQGTHAELLADEGGAYSKLVRAQKLREQKEALAGEDGAEAGASGAVEVPAEDIKIGLERKSTQQSLGSAILKQRGQLGAAGADTEAGRWADEDMGLWTLFRRLAEVNQAGWKNYALGFVAACLTGMVYPAFGVVYAKGINSFSQIDKHTRQFDSDRVALWFFIIAIGSTLTIGVQNYLFAAAAGELSSKLRALSFRAILRQDIEFFDREENSTGSLTSRLSDNPQKVNGLAGVTLGAIVQSVAIVIAGTVLGLVFVWKLGLVGLACMPLVISAGYIRLVSNSHYSCGMTAHPFAARRRAQGPDQQEGPRRLRTARVRSRRCNPHRRLPHARRPMRRAVQRLPRGPAQGLQPHRALEQPPLLALAVHVLLRHRAHLLVRLAPHREPRVLHVRLLRRADEHGVWRDPGGQRVLVCAGRVVCQGRGLGYIQTVGCGARDRRGVGRGEERAGRERAGAHPPRERALPVPHAPWRAGPARLVAHR